MKTYRQLRAKLLQDKKTKRAYEDLKPQFAFVRMVIQKRIERGLTQKDLAKRIGTKQSAISRLESGTYNPTLSFIGKVANALNASVAISLKGK
ncbi:MAG: transcriptional regulator [Candidatus Wildermuthbacteria bacterium RIFCSPHIGHO2_01_FULL_48_25]|uniref:Transcriptional regulator n=1 Tax=Candidatus Wildermuthbacteria bacterium RIFCSPLOWO2_01_FULL_48_16 TaxID=1802461 RepID=A0A1G2RNX7_9BACT|nr:MAG: transcriptional regulator [Candidatus Wildermuthbacteria bacterium RIFCSPHIGHO2_01_FULL_48_25]OHA68676.1 MAG: transcriptional regulator [Candidatus Wildermuthbacteria bacterium RIFCSPHIGHO2_02_FULL_49_12b]OHA73731.1 MAG: transcriptional regulator [Candidatus Wildermuthbacteria bacterium RIFCSPLOWO2_01_FULL_48_16]